MKLLRLADSRGARNGRCGLCDGEAVEWTRSGRRPTDADGIVLAALACEAHRAVIDAALAAVTIEDVVSLSRGHKRRRADAARRRADRLTGRCAAWGRAAADLVGASSATHTAALIAGAVGLEAAALYRLADALSAAHKQRSMPEAVARANGEVLP